jgi:hypothetical protein
MGRSPSRVSEGWAERRLTHRLPFPDRRPTVGHDTDRVLARSAHVFVTDARTRRRTLIAFLAASFVLTLIVGPSPAAAASKSACAKAVVADWYGDGRVDRIFPQHCYQEAIRSLPVDVLDYSNAKEDILRALQFARQNKPDPGPAGGGQSTTDTTDTTDPGSGGPDDDPSDPGSPGDETVAAPGVDTSGPSSIPIPLFILGGLALLLLAAGGAGYLSRRAQARREGGPPGTA